MTRGELRDAPIFIVGAARSGTTLVYSLLLSSGVFPVYEAESRILECAIRYGSLRSRRNQRRFLEDFTNSRQFARSGLSETTMSTLVDRAQGSYLNLLRLFMEQMCLDQCRQRWIEKSPNNAFHVGQLASHFPLSRFIHVVRDGRAVAVSQRKLGWGKRYSADRRRQLIWTANTWSLQVEAGQKARRLGPDRYFEIRYEDLVGDYPQSLERLARFADVRIDPRDIRESDIGSLRASNSAFDRTSVGITADAVDRWRGTLEGDEGALLDWIVGDRVGKLGYGVRGAPSGWRPSPEDRLTAVVSRLALLGKRWMNRWTPLGRLARKPLEIGFS